MKSQERRSKGKARSRPRPASSRARTIFYTLAAIISLAGLAESTYLTVSHLAGETLACIASQGCSEVLSSKYARVGQIPLAAFGMAGYFLVFSLAILAAFGELRVRKFLMLAVAVMFLATLWLLYVQAFILHAFCDYCLLSAAFIFALAGVLIVVPPPRPESVEN